MPGRLMKTALGGYSAWKHSWENGIWQSSTVSWNFKRSRYQTTRIVLVELGGHQRAEAVEFLRLLVGDGEDAQHRLGGGLLGPGGG